MVHWALSFLGEKLINGNKVFCKIIRLKCEQPFPLRTREFLTQMLVEHQLPATCPCVRAGNGPSGQRTAPALRALVGLVMERTDYTRA